MARRRKNYTLDEQLEMINIEIENTEQNLINSKVAKEDIEEQIKMRRLLELDELISESGKRYEEVKELLSRE